MAVYQRIIANISFVQFAKKDSHYMFLQSNIDGEVKEIEH